MRLHLCYWKDDSEGRMTDDCSTQSTRKGMGLVEKSEFFEKSIQTMGIRPALFLSIQGRFKHWKGL